MIKTNVDVLPTLSILKNLPAGKRLVKNYSVYCNRSNLTRHKVNEVLDKIPMEFSNKLIKLRDQELYYAQVKSVELIEYSDWVYDIEVEDNHNFIANNILCHNTLGGIAYTYLK